MREGNLEVFNNYIFSNWNDVEKKKRKERRELPRIIYPEQTKKFAECDEKKIFKFIFQNSELENRFSWR